MNINNKLKELIDNYTWDYGLWDGEIEDFFNSYPGSEERKKKSKALIEKIMTAHGKEDLYSYLSELARIEDGIKKLEPWVRDHVSHAMLCYLLGIFINEYYLKDNFKIHIENFQWKLAGLFHDIGYPVEIAQNLLVVYNKKIDEIINKLGIPKEDKPLFKVSYDDIINLTHGKSSLELIQNQLNKWGLHINVKVEYTTRKESGKVCHGIISSLLLLRTLDFMYDAFNPHREYKNTYHKYSDINWNQSNFETHVVQACSAIFIHNLPVEAFNGVKINPQNAPLAFTLKLADTLQDWERPSKDLAEGISADLFELEYKDNSIKIVTSIEQKRIDKINKEIIEFLEVENIMVEKNKKLWPIA
jgi:hypothetical protein